MLCTTCNIDIAKVDGLNSSHCHFCDKIVCEECMIEIECCNKIRYRCSQCSWKTCGNDSDTYTCLKCNTKDYVSNLSENFTLFLKENSQNEKILLLCPECIHD